MGRNAQYYRGPPGDCACCHTGETLRPATCGYERDIVTFRSAYFRGAGHRRQDAGRGGTQQFHGVARRRVLRNDEVCGRPSQPRSPAEVDAKYCKLLGSPQRGRTGFVTNESHFGTCAVFRGAVRGDPRSSSPRRDRGITIPGCPNAPTVIPHSRATAQECFQTSLSAQRTRCNQPLARRSPRHRPRSRLPSPTAQSLTVGMKPRASCRAP